MDKKINTWQPGKFTPLPGWSAMSDAWKKEQRDFETTKVHAGETEKPICFASSPGTALWISHRLNVASDLERLLIEFAENKTDGKEMTQYVAKLMNQ